MLVGEVEGLRRQRQGDLRSIRDEVSFREPGEPERVIGLQLHRGGALHVAGTPPRGANQWPAGHEAMRAAMVRYFKTMERVGERMLPVLARALDLPAGWFTPFFRSSPCWPARRFPGWPCGYRAASGWHHR